MEGGDEVGGLHERPHGEDLAQPGGAVGTEESITLDDHLTHALRDEEGPLLVCLVRGGDSDDCGRKRSQLAPAVSQASEVVLGGGLVFLDRVTRSFAVARWSRRLWRHSTSPTAPIEPPLLRTVSVHSTSPTAGRPPSPGRCAAHWQSRSRSTRRMER